MFWRPQPDLNRRRRRERAVSWAGLDDGDRTAAATYVLHKSGYFNKGVKINSQHLDLFGEPRWDRTNDHLIKSQVLYLLS